MTTYTIMDTHKCKTLDDYINMFCTNNPDTELVDQTENTFTVDINGLIEMYQWND